MEQFKSKFNGCVFEKHDNGRCYQVDNAYRGGEEIKKKVKRRVSGKEYETQKTLHNQILAEGCRV